MPAKSKINMKALRIVVLSMFVLSVAVTTWSLLAMHSHYHHILNMTHVVMITLTFLLIAFYLYKSAELASLIVYRELSLRLSVDPSVGYIEYMPGGAPVFCACAGALAKKGIYVKSPGAMAALAGLKRIAITGNSESREGYIATEHTLEEMGVEFSDDTGSCPVKLMLGRFDADAYKEYDFILTNDKIAFVLAAIYISRLYVRFLRFSRVLLICALAAAVVLSIFKQFTFAGAAIAFWAASELLIVRMAETKTKRLTFKSVSSL